MRQSPSPYDLVTSGEVSARVPDTWHAAPASEMAREGFVASPRPHAWGRLDGSVAGMSATWVDATQVGVPSDFYYLAATGPALGRLTDSAVCRAVHLHVYVNDRPSWISGDADSPGDFLARGEGTCDVRGVPTRWAYFVAAPGYGPVHGVGIPASGLYVVVVVLPDSHRAAGTLRRILAGTRFGNATLGDLIRAASQ